MSAAEFAIGRKPDYKVSALNKSNSHKGNVGAAWNNKDGSITIKLNSFVVLSAVQDLVVTLFPNDDKQEKRSAPSVE